MLLEGYRGGEEKEHFLAEIFKALCVSNAVWQKEAKLQILPDWRSCPVGLLFKHIGADEKNTENLI